MDKLKNRFTKLFNNKIILIFGIIIQLPLIYGLTYWGYHSSRLPYWFDNFVQRTGIWRIYGEKEYGEEPFENLFWFDPRLDIVKDSLILHRYEGYPGKIEQIDGNVKMEVISNQNRDIDTVEFSNNDLKSICINRSCEDNGLEDIENGGLLIVYNFSNIRTDEHFVYLFLEVI